MSSPTQFFLQLCSALQNFHQMPLIERNLEVYKKAADQTLNTAIEMVPEILKGDFVHKALNSAMASRSPDLVKAFPKEAYGTYMADIRPLDSRPHLETDMVFALSERGMMLKPLYRSLLTCAFADKDDSLRKWALDYLAPNPDDFEWMSHFTPLNIKSSPDFAEDLLTRAVAASPSGASLKLAKALDWLDGLQVALLLQAGVRPPYATKPHVKSRFDAISNHQKLRMTRPSIAEFCRDDEAILAARHLFLKRA